MPGECTWIAVDRVFITVGSYTAALGVALGAFGRHHLQGALSTPMAAAYDTAVRYHLIHALGVVAVGCILRIYPRNRFIEAAGWMLCAGVVLFSGSLYLMAFLSYREIAVLTPLGGVALLLGWIFLATGMSKK